MNDQIQIVGMTMEQAKAFFKEIVMECLAEKVASPNLDEELPISISDACKLFGISPPTLRKFVDLKLVRRHDLGPKKKRFYLSELKEDMARLEEMHLGDRERFRQLGISEL
ncbi:MAG: hypothetical protein P4L51_23415 [Puia sp.]|nr:hypothetical protein [Puia sp.]